MADNDGGINTLLVGAPFSLDSCRKTKRQEDEEREEVREGLDKSHGGPNLQVNE